MQVDKISLDSIDFDNLQLIHNKLSIHGDQDHRRCIYFDSKSNLYYKVWDTTYIRRDNILNAIDIGFYDETTVPGLKGVLYYNDICRGYVMEHVDITTKDISIFFELIKQKTIETNYFYFDYCTKHVMEYQGKCCLIDLEGIYHISELNNFLNHNYYSSFADEQYKEFVCNIVK